MIYLVRYGEIAIKSDNVRGEFENILIRNIKRAIGECFITKERGRIILESENEISNKLKKVFGIVSFSPVKVIEIETIADINKNLNLNFDGTFSVRVKRTGFSGKSTEIERKIGAYIVDKTGAKVNLQNPDKKFMIEIRDKKAYIYDEIVKCFGGLPIGTGGKVFVDINNDNDIIATWMIMKRGNSIRCKGDHSFLDDWHHGVKIEEGNMDESCDAMISSERDLSKIKKNDLVLYPLLGKKQKEINELYDKIIF